ncbi:MAG: prefoldin subunit beta [Thermoplasmata archaeon]|nr:prefoldin subunit beta [Thermoplasmata archaeon]
MEIPKKVQDQLVQYQQLEQQLEALYMQRTQTSGQIAEVKNAMEVLEKAPEDTTVFQASGNILVRQPGRSSVIADLKDRLELLEVRLKAIGKQEEGLRERYGSLQKDISNALKGMQAG